MYFSGFDLQISSPIVLTKGHTPGLDDANKAMMAGERNNAGHVARRTKILKPREVKQGKVTSLQAEISNRRK